MIFLSKNHRVLFVDTYTYLGRDVYNCGCEWGGVVYNVGVVGDSGIL